MLPSVLPKGWCKRCDTVRSVPSTWFSTNTRSNTMCAALCPLYSSTNNHILHQVMDVRLACADTIINKRFLETMLPKTNTW